MKTWKTTSGYAVTQVLAGRSNVFLLSNDRSHVLIDTGPQRNWRKLRRRLDKLTARKIDLLLLTHTHYDHAGNAKSIQETYKARVAVHRAEMQFLQKGLNRFPGGTNPFTRFLINRLGHRMSSKFNFPPCEPDVLITSVWDLEDLGFHAYVLPTPGHTAGSVSLIIDDEIALVGDAMFGVFRHSIFPPFADHADMLVESWGILLKTNCSLFLPAHGFGNNREKVQKNYERF
jgi:glyoxylase-like metal-dependent hydrolase (beta-lactamase superfamily II)